MGLGSAAEKDRKQRALFMAVGRVHSRAASPTLGLLKKLPLKQDPRRPEAKNERGC